ncbi:hypothetical protein [Jatrophihabitans sp.]|uniref:hypothetical protein n=1 Tax=Jatrophihabitans sp. TaxID=1932789 RepID=UPI0030C751E3|nr:hypothetical protein [Jatrophihabitans sp.]
MDASSREPTPDLDRWGYQPTASPPPPLSTPAARRRSRRLGRRSWLALAAMVVVAAGVTAGLALSGGNSSAPPADAVRAYLDDLAAGNAAGALAQGTAVPDTTLLTAAVLAKQRALARISAITVGATERSDGQTSVSASYRFGNRTVRAAFPVSRHGSRWLLTQTAYPIDVSALDGVPEPSLFGLPISGKSVVYVFPGPLSWGSTNRYFTVTDRSSNFATSPADTPTVTLRATLNTAGTRAVEAAITSFVRSCSASKRLAPLGCPQSNADEGAVDGSVHWSAPKTSGLKVTAPDPQTPTTLSVTGQLTWHCTYAVHGSSHRATDDNVPAAIDGTVDLTAQHPKLTLAPTS